MKLKLLIMSIVALSLFACNQNETANEKKETEKEVKINKKVSVNKADLEVDKAGLTLIADSIMYDATIKNPTPDEAAYMNEWLKGLDIAKFADILFKAVYDGKFKAYDYFTGEELTIEQVKEIEKKHKRKDIAKALFTEQWYFDESELKMYKIVNSIMLSYERFDEEDGSKLQGYTPGFRIYLNGTKPMKPAMDY